MLYSLRFTTHVPVQKQIYKEAARMFTTELLIKRDRRKKKTINKETNIWQS